MEKINSAVCLPSETDKHTLNMEQNIYNTWASSNFTVMIAGLLLVLDETTILSCTQHFPLKPHVARGRTLHPLPSPPLFINNLYNLASSMTVKKRFELIRTEWHCLVMGQLRGTFFK